jgi:hypothetical protein
MYHKPLAQNIRAKLGWHIVACNPAPLRPMGALPQAHIMGPHIAATYGKGCPVRVMLHHYAPLRPQQAMHRLKQAINRGYVTLVQGPTITPTPIKVP